MVALLLTTPAASVRFITPPLPGRPAKKGRVSVSEIKKVSIGNSALSAEISTVGASLMKLLVSGIDVVLGYDDPGEYLKNPCYFGATCGRVANRIKGGELVLPKKSGGKVRRR